MTWICVSLLIAELETCFSGNRSFHRWHVSITVSTDAVPDSELGQDVALTDAIGLHGREVAGGEWLAGNIVTDEVGPAHNTD